MSEEVVKWLQEINSLKQQLTHIQLERDETKLSEANWRQRYMEEAQQRRTETRLAREQIELLQDQIRRSQQEIKIPANPGEVTAAIAKEVSELGTQEEAKEKLIQVMQQRDQALKSLQEERENHEQTRKSLTSVINDTIEQLTKLKKANPQ